MSEKLANRSSLKRFAVASASMLLLVMACGAALDARAQAAVTSPRVDLGDFQIDLTEVSIGRFAEYAQRKGIQTEAERSGGGSEYVMGWKSARVGIGAPLLAVQHSQMSLLCT